MPLPIAPMLSRTGELPTGDGWSYEVKFDGFRALVSTEDGLQVPSRRGWNMTGGRSPSSVSSRRRPSPGW